MKLRLTFNVEYAAHGVSERELSDRLAAVCDQAMADGWLTGDTPAEVLNTSCTVREIDTRGNSDDAYEAFMSMPQQEWLGLLVSLASGGCLEFEENKGFERALRERKRPQS
ncbi:MAG: hypothetical protein EBW87_03195 [Burkholderiaceae bacterium]|nr:hypothetical protein [Burkholderiaceae bacterium]